MQQIHNTGLTIGPALKIKKKQPEYKAKVHSLGIFLLFFSSYFYLAQTCLQQHLLCFSVKRHYLFLISVSSVIYIGFAIS